MKKKELIELLKELASQDLFEGADIDDHVCSVAARALDKCFQDIDLLRSISPKNKGNKKTQMLVKMPYDPDL